MRHPFSQDSLAFPSAARSSFSQDVHTHIISTARSFLTRQSYIHIHHPRSFSQGMPGTLSRVSALTAFTCKIRILTRPLRSVSATAFLQCQNCHKNTHEGDTFLTRTSGYHAFTNSLIPFFCHNHHSLRKNKHQKHSHTKQRLNYTIKKPFTQTADFWFGKISFVFALLLLYIVFCCFLPPPAVASRNALLGAPATDSEGENGKDWNSIARQWKRTPQVWPLTRGVVQTAANPTKDTANCCGNGDFSLGFVARCLSAWWHRLSSPCITECMW